MLVYGSSQHARLNSPAIHTAPRSCLTLWLRPGARKKFCQAMKLRGGFNIMDTTEHTMNKNLGAANAVQRYPLRFSQCHEPATVMCKGPQPIKCWKNLASQ